MSLTNSAEKVHTPGSLPLNKDSRTFPGGSQRSCPLSSETLLNPTAQGILLSTSPRELPAEGGDTPSLRLGVYTFSFGVIFTYSS